MYKLSILVSLILPLVVALPVAAAPGVTANAEEALKRSRASEGRVLGEHQLVDQNGNALDLGPRHRGAPIADDHRSANNNASQPNRQNCRLTGTGKAAGGGAIILHTEPRRSEIVITT